MNWKEYPKNWEIVRLEKVLDRLSNGLAKSQNKESHGIPVTRIETIKDEIVDSERVGYLEDASESDFRKFSLEVGDILFSHINSESHIGKTAIYEGYPKVLLHGMNLLLLRVKKSECDPFYINYLLKRYRFKNIFASIAARAVGQASINQGKMKSLEIPLPPLPEQRAIARALRAVQAAREARLREIALERERKAALMEHLFTHGTRGEPTRMTEIGEMPESWEIAKLGEVVRSTQYGLSVRGNSEGCYPILRMNCLVDGYANGSDLQYVDLDEADFQKFRLNKGDILFNRTNSSDLVGKTGLFDMEGNFVFASYLIRLIVNENRLSSAFLNYYTNMNSIQTRLRMLASRGVSQSNINAAKLRGFTIPLPLLTEQKIIADTIKACDHLIFALESETQILDELFRAMLEELMTGRLRAGALATP